MKPRMKQMLRTIVNLCVLMSVFWGDFVTSDRGPNIKREGMKIPEFDLGSLYIITRTPVFTYIVMLANTDSFWCACASIRILRVWLTRQQI